ncbi:MAG: ribulose-phosphate 3-epimerase [Bryobacterales bacterium]|nr:ribulose-phosphate 3-epimerase [Bryobacterales bacterium]
MIEILPSLLAADFANLQSEVARVRDTGITMLHCDVMDGHFVPNLSLGVPVVASLRKVTALKLDVHLMIEEPDRYIEAFAEAGADSISVHQEACRHLDRTIRLIQGTGRLAGVVLNPATPIATLDEVLPIVDYVLLMSVNPGFGGQHFIGRVLDKVRALERERRSRGLGFPIQIDGGISARNIGECVRAGVDWFVVGSSVFGAKDPAAAIQEMQAEAREATALRA